MSLVSLILIVFIRIYISGTQKSFLLQESYHFSTRKPVINSTNRQNHWQSLQAWLHGWLSQQLWNSFTLTHQELYIHEKRSSKTTKGIPGAHKFKLISTFHHIKKKSPSWQTSGTDPINPNTFSWRKTT